MDRTILNRVHLPNSTDCSIFQNSVTLFKNVVLSSQEADLCHIAIGSPGSVQPVLIGDSSPGLWVKKVVCSKCIQIS